jgi:hypothetical protein
MFVIPNLGINFNSFGYQIDVGCTTSLFSSFIEIIDDVD